VDERPEIGTGQMPHLSERQQLARLRNRVRELESEQAAFRQAHGDDAALIRELQDQNRRLKDEVRRLMDEVARLSEA
jgi:chromosome segregation ATPase